MNDAKYITVNQAMEIFHLGRRTVRKRMDEIGATVKMGKRVLFDTDIIKGKYGDFQVTPQKKECTARELLSTYVMVQWIIKDEPTMTAVDSFLKSECHTANECFHVLTTILMVEEDKGDIWDLMRELNIISKELKADG